MSNRFRALLLLPLVVVASFAAPHTVGSRSGAPAHAFRLGADAGRSPSSAALRSLSWHGGIVVAATGEPVRVEISDAYPPDAVSAQAWADFFAGLLHGEELGVMRARIAPPVEVDELCGGGGALGCYGGDELVVPGEPSDGIAAESIARHEYGHHVAAHRVNTPWRAVDWGTKRWSTRESVCSRARAGTAKPGDEGGGYRLNPGEAFAEAYRVLNERRAGLPLWWSIVDESFVPDDADLAAVEQDVSTPWSRGTVAVYRARFSGNGPKRVRLRLATPLDGLATVVLRMPRGVSHTAAVFDAGGRLVARGLWAGTRVQRLAFEVCGGRTATVVVSRGGPASPFSLTMTTP